MTRHFDDDVMFHDSVRFVGQPVMFENNGLSVVTNPTSNINPISLTKQTDPHQAIKLLRI